MANYNEYLLSEAEQKREAFHTERMKLPGYAEGLAKFVSEANENARLMELERRSKIAKLT